METTIKDRIKEFMAYKGLTQRAFENACKLSTGYVNNIVKTIGANKLQNILTAYPEINTSWLLTGEGAMIKGQTEEQAQLKVTEQVKDLGGVYAVGDTDIAQVDYVPVSAHATFVENLYLPNAEQQRYPVVLAADEKKEIEKFKVFEVDGDSMFPSISSGALILAKEIPEKSWHYAEGVVVVIFAEFVVVKRVERNDLLANNLVVLSSDNEKYGKLVVQLSDIRAIYKAKRILSSIIK